MDSMDHGPLVAKVLIIKNGPYNHRQSPIELISDVKIDKRDPFTMYSAVCSVPYAVCSVQCAVCSVQCAVCGVRCAVCSVWCAVCSDMISADP